MPDWYVRRNEPGSEWSDKYPYSVRLGGCEYSLTEEEFYEMAKGFDDVYHHFSDYRESEDYKDIVIADANKPRQRESLRSLLGIGKAVINRRGM